MQRWNQSKLDISLNYLVCSLYTLSEYNPVFKKLILKNTIYINKNNKNHFLNNSDNFTEFYKFLDSAAVRRFAIILLHPLLKKGYLSYSFIKDNELIDKDSYNEMFLLKRYLRKFTYNYLNYFHAQNENLENFSNRKELNTAALKSLFLLAGI